MSRRSDLKFDNTGSQNCTLLFDFLWGWLNGSRLLFPLSYRFLTIGFAVNTRSIYYQIKSSRSDADNLTMCPILDFANHTSTLKHMSLIPAEVKPWNVSSPGKKRGDLSFLSPRDIIQKGEEVNLRYGAHSNLKLFVEYGFVNKMPDTAISSDEQDGEVDVQDIVEQLFQARGKLGLWMKDKLQENGYWG